MCECDIDDVVHKILSMCRILSVKTTEFGLHFRIPLSLKYKNRMPLSLFRISCFKSKDFKAQLMFRTAHDDRVNLNISYSIHIFLLCFTRLHF